MSSQIDNVEQQFMADFLLVCTWVDKTLIGADPHEIESA
jgi:hypothetical protein